jgi:hypothetical protein
MASWVVWNLSGIGLSAADHKMMRLYKNAFGTSQHSDRESMCVCVSVCSCACEVADRRGLLEALDDAPVKITVAQGWHVSVDSGWHTKSLGYS